jgi:glycosyltransferase involved in cell wall biosynthesis
MDFVYSLSELNNFFSFLIIGEDRVFDKKYLEDKNLKIISKVSHNIGLDLLKGIDVALLPLGDKVMLNSKVDIGSYTSPLKLFEYWSSGCLVIISGNSVLLDVCIPNFNCVKIDKLDSLLWFEMLESINSNRGFYSDIILNGYNHFIQNYTWDIRASSILEFQNQYKNNVAI